MVAFDLSARLAPAPSPPTKFPKKKKRYRTARSRLSHWAFEKEKNGEPKLLCSTEKTNNKKQKKVEKKNGQRKKCAQQIKKKKKKKKSHLLKSKAFFCPFLLLPPTFEAATNCIVFCCNGLGWLCWGKKKKKWGNAIKLNPKNSALLPPPQKKKKKRTMKTEKEKVFVF